MGDESGDDDTHHTNPADERETDVDYCESDSSGTVDVRSQEEIDDDSGASDIEQI
jgi:hypothetical protein